jgi:hypothetical protein
VDRNSFSLLGLQLKQKRGEIPGLGTNDYFSHRNVPPFFFIFALFFSAIGSEQQKQLRSILLIDRSIEALPFAKYISASDYVIERLDGSLLSVERKTIRNQIITNTRESLNLEGKKSCVN